MMYWKRRRSLAGAACDLPEDVLPRQRLDGEKRTTPKLEVQRLDLVRRRERLLEHIRSSRAAFERETLSRRRLLATFKPPPPTDQLLAEIEAAWQRLYADYAQFRRLTPYPVRKGSERRGR